MLFDKVAFEGLEKGAGTLALAGIIVFFAGLSASLGTIFAPVDSPYQLHSMVIMFLVMVSAFLTWLVWAELSYLIGTKVLRGQATFKEILRNLGFAYLPILLSVLLALPNIRLGLLVMFILLVWMAIIGYVAVMGAEKFGVVKALVTTVLCWLVGIAAMANVLTSTRLIS